MWKETNKQSKVNEAFLARIIAAIHVDHVTHGLERIERDSNRQEELQRGQINRNSNQTEDAGKLLGKEAIVLKQTQQAELNDYGSDQNSFATRTRLAPGD